MSGKPDRSKRKRELSDIDNNDQGLSTKRRCVNHNNRKEQNISSTKNFANNRLKRLKDAIQADLKSKNTNNSGTDDLPCKTLAGPNVKQNFSSKCAENGRSKKKSVEENGCFDKHFLVQKETDNIFNLTGNDAKKNMANERLTNIKNMLNHSGYGKNVAANTGHIEENTSMERPHCSKIEPNTDIIVGFKRNISHISSDDEVCDKSSICKRLAIQSTKLIKNMVNKIENCTTKDGTEIIKSGDLIALKQNDYIPNNKSNIEDNVFNNTNTRISKIKNCDLTNHDKDFNKSKSSVIPLKNSIENANNPPKNENVSSCLESVPHSSLARESNGSFSSKMAMTASWVMNLHQNGSDEANNSLGTSLTVNVDESTANVNFDETEDMEWANAEPDNEVLQTSQNNYVNKHVDNKNDKLKDLCVVVDTNVFISGLQKIRNIMDMKVTGPSKPIILIPWMVMTELDDMKHSSSNSKLKKNITNSITFINNMLEQKHPRIIGETVHDVEKQKYVGKSPDDKIIACCLQVAEKYEKVILASNDVNLKSKALIHGIPASSSDEILMKILSKLSKTDKSKKVIDKMGTLCTTIICECAKEAYGNVWVKMDMLSNAPWPLVDCLKRFKKYWNSVFREKLLRQFMRANEELLSFLESNKCICDDSQEYIKLVKLCITLCIFLKDIEESRGFTENFLREITNLA